MENEQEKPTVSSPTFTALLCDDVYRSCVSEKGNCAYMKLNDYNIETCSIDNIVQVRFYGCKPSEINKDA